MKKSDDINPRLVVWERMAKVQELLTKAKIPQELARMLNHYPEYKQLAQQLMKDYRIMALKMREIIESVNHEVVQDDARASMKIYIDLMKLLDKVVKEIPSSNPSEKKQILAVGERLNKAHNYAWFGPNTSASDRVDWKSMSQKMIDQAKKYYRGIALSNLPGAAAAYKYLKDFDVLLNKFTKETMSAFEN